MKDCFEWNKKRGVNVIMNDALVGIISSVTFEKLGDMFYKSYQEASSKNAFGLEVNRYNIFNYVKPRRFIFRSDNGTHNYELLCDCFWSGKDGISLFFDNEEVFIDEIS